MNQFEDAITWSACNNAFHTVVLSPYCILILIAVEPAHDAGVPDEPDSEYQIADRFDSQETVETMLGATIGHDLWAGP